MQTFDNPRSRLTTVTVGLARDRSLANIFLGLFLGALVQTAAPTPWWWVAGAGLLWVFSVVLYSLVDEVMQAIEEEKNRLLDPAAGRPRGIE